MAVVVLSVAFLVTLVVVLLRFTTVLRQMSESMRIDKAQYAAQVDAGRAAAFADAMTALEHVQERVMLSQRELLDRTVEVFVGPHNAVEPSVDDPRLDLRTLWQPDDEYDYTGLGIDPTDETMPAPRLEPEGNEGRATMVRPGEGLLPS